MNQRKFYIAIILGLVGLNILVLAFFLLTKPRTQHHPPPEKFQSEVIKILSLNKQQVVTFRALADEHKLQMNAINERKAKLLLPYFESLVDNSKIIDSESLLIQFQHAEKEKIELTYQHFQELKEILNKEQLPDFEIFMRRVTERILSGEQKKSPPRKGF